MGLAARFSAHGRGRHPLYGAAGRQRLGGQHPGAAKHPASAFKPAGIVIALTFIWPAPSWQVHRAARA